MKRVLFNLLVGVSLLLCGAAVVFWFRSYHSAEDWAWQHFSYTTPAHAGQSDCVRIGTAGGVLTFFSSRFYWVQNNHEGTLYRYSKSQYLESIDPRIEYGSNARVWHQFSIARWHSGPAPTRRIVQDRLDAISTVGAQLSTVRSKTRADQRKQLQLEQQLVSLMSQPLPGTWLFAFSVPAWFIVILSLLLPMIKLRLVLRRGHRWNKGLCLACGYDLRATPQRCPECGAMPKKIGATA